MDAEKLDAIERCAKADYDLSVVRGLSVFDQKYWHASIVAQLSLIAEVRRLWGEAARIDAACLAACPDNSAATIGEPDEELGRYLCLNENGDELIDTSEPAEVVKGLSDLWFRVSERSEQQDVQVQQLQRVVDSRDDDISELRERLTALETVDGALATITQRIKRLEDVQRCAQGLLATIFVAPNADEKVAALIPHTKALADALTAARGGG